MRAGSSWATAAVAVVGWISATPGTAADALLHPFAGPGNVGLHPALEISLFAAEPQVVDPVALAYVAYTAELVDGESETGVLVADTSGTVVLMQAGERRVELPRVRVRVRSMKSSGRSLMPEGLETGMTPRAVRDLIAFLQEPVEATGERGTP